MTEFFSRDEINTLREHQIELYAGRVIFDAQPPMTAQEIAAVQSQCGGPVPAQLIELWSRTAGGNLDYDLTIDMNGREEAISWAELFFNGSDGYNDLQGWIEHEIELAREAEEEEEEEEEEENDVDDPDVREKEKHSDENHTDPESGKNAASPEEENQTDAENHEEVDDHHKHNADAEDDSDGKESHYDGLLRYLPFGGFEYCDRIYIVVAEGLEYGNILGWKKGLPPAWTDSLHRDSVATIAPDLVSGLQALCLHEDPLTPVSEYYAGESLKTYLQTRIDEHGLEQALANKLMEFYRQAVIDWKTPLETQTIDKFPTLARIAMATAIEADDDDLISRLRAAGVSCDKPVRGIQLPIITAISSGSFKAVKALVEAGAAVPDRAFKHVDDPIPVEVVRLLLANGATPTAEAIAQCAACGALESAREIAKAYSLSGGETATDFDNARNKLLRDLKTSLDKLRSGNNAHYLGQEGLASRVMNLRNFTVDADN